MSNDTWVVALKNKSLPELQAQYEEYKEQLVSYGELKEVRNLETEESQDFLTKSYRSAMIWNEMRARA